MMPMRSAMSSVTPPRPGRDPSPPAGEDLARLLVEAAPGDEAVVDRGREYGPNAARSTARAPARSSVTQVWKRATISSDADFAGARRTDADVLDHAWHRLDGHHVQGDAAAISPASRASAASAPTWDRDRRRRRAHEQAVAGELRSGRDAGALAGGIERTVVTVSRTRASGFRTVRRSSSARCSRSTRRCRG